MNRPRNYLFIGMQVLFVASFLMVGLTFFKEFSSDEFKREIEIASENHETWRQRCTQSNGDVRPAPGLSGLVNNVCVNRDDPRSSQDACVRAGGEVETKSGFLGVLRFMCKTGDGEVVFLAQR